MTINWRNISMFAGMAALLLFVGFFQSWTLSLTIVNLCLISAIMALGVNIQWGYAGLLNVGVMGFAALGGLAAVLVSHAAGQRRLGRRRHWHGGISAVSCRHHRR
jgi:branched-chain amino acid transport system permease protein